MPDENLEAKPAAVAEQQSSGSAGLSSVAAQDETKSSAHGEPMEIHAPEKPIHSRREFLFHMFTVVLGILIALGMESVVEWAHHRALVREARENIATEIRKNKETVDKGIVEIHQRQTDLNHIVDLMRRAKKDRMVFKGESMHFGIAVNDLYATAWQTATTSGAVTYMKYDELSRYTDVYLTQQTYTTLQDQALNQMIDVGSLMEVTMRDDDMTRVPADKFQAIARGAYKEIILQRALEDISGSLTKGYADLLKSQ